MDEAIARKRLADAEAAVADEVGEIEKHRAFIEKLREEGHETGQAERSLAILERSLGAMKHHRDIMLEHLGLYETGEGGTNPTGFDATKLRRQHP